MGAELKKCVTCPVKTFDLRRHICDKRRKIKKIQSVINQSDERGMFNACYKFLEDTGDLKTNYHDYLTTSPIDCDTELQRLPEADYELSTALLTMILREDRFVDRAFHMRYEKGQVEEILKHMIQTL